MSNPKRKLRKTIRTKKAKNDLLPPSLKLYHLLLETFGSAADKIEMLHVNHQPRLHWGCSARLLEGGVLPG